VLEDPDLRDEAHELDPGDTVVFYTDGVTEAGAPRRILDPEALESLVASCHGLEPAALASRIERSAVEATGGDLRDDIAILVARVRPAELGSPAVVGDESRVEAG
jgi:serine phosphatase RsbU (regulator of sigma subunit)